MAAVNSQDKECWFPPNDDVLLLPQGKTFSRSASAVGSTWSGLSSPFGSELGSTETESEEEEGDDEFMAELTRQMADYMLQEDDDDESVAKKCEDIKVELPKEENPKEENQEFNQVKKSKLGVAKRVETTPKPEPRKPIRAPHGGAGVLGAAPMMWPPLQPPPQVTYGSGMQAVFLGGAPALQAKTGGTGVFLPRGVSNPPEVRKKLGCSTVLIPTRVLNALQVHFQNVNNQSQSNGSAGLKSYQPQYDITPAQARQRSQAQNKSAKTISDIGLPQEWTY